MIRAVESEIFAKDVSKMACSQSRSSQDVREGAGAGARGLKQEPSLAKKKAI